MGLYKVTESTLGGPNDLNQVIDAFTGRNDVGEIIFYQALSVPVAPLVAVNAIAGVLNGNYKYAVSFVTGYANSQGTIITQGNTSGGVASAIVSPASQQVNISSIPIGSEGVVARYIYRTKAGGNTFYFLQQLADNVTTSWTDNVADSSLTTVMPDTNSTGTRLIADGSGLYNLPLPEPVISETEPTTGLYSGLVWYKPSTNQTKQYLNGAFRSVGGSTLVCLLSSFTVVLNGTTNCLINQGNYNPNMDVLEVFYKNIPLDEVDNYTKNLDGISIDLVGFSLAAGEKVRYKIWKTVLSDVFTYDGSLITFSTIGNSQLGTDIKIGSLSLLPTTAKGDAVSAITEVYNNINSLAGVGNTTTVKALYDALSGHQADFANYQTTVASLIQAARIRSFMGV